MVATGWNPGASGGVVVVPVIGQYLELGYFCTARWPERPCHCPGNLGGLRIDLCSGCGYASIGENALPVSQVESCSQRHVEIRNTLVVSS